MTARVILFACLSSAGITKQDLLIGAHGVNHPGLVVMALGDVKILVVKHSHCQ
jgi:hypothetical protein